MPDTTIREEDNLIFVKDSPVVANSDLPLPLLLSPIVFGQDVTRREPHDWARPPEGTFRYSDDTQTAELIANDLADPSPLAYIGTPTQCLSTCTVYSCGFTDTIYDRPTDDILNDGQ